jgi:hypothetical protein
VSQVLGLNEKYEDYADKLRIFHEYLCVTTSPSPSSFSSSSSSSSTSDDNRSRGGVIIADDDVVVLVDAYDVLLLPIAKTAAGQVTAAIFNIS